MSLVVSTGAVANFDIFRVAVIRVKAFSQHFYSLSEMANKDKQVDSYLENSWQSQEKNWKVNTSECPATTASQSKQPTENQAVFKQFLLERLLID